MNTIFILLTLGIVGVIAKPVENSAFEPSPNNIALETTEVSALNLGNKSKTDIPEINEILIDDETESNVGTTLDIFVEEKLSPPDVEDQEIVPDFGTEISEGNGEILYNDVLNRDPNETMDTAAGFLPVPIIRKRHRQTSNRRYATRRDFRRKPRPYRRVYFFYPSYGFYPHSSLRYY